MTDEDIRDMLAERAGAIRPSTDGLSKIEARLAEHPVTARRRPPVPMLAAAAVTVLALVGVTVFVQRDDETSVEIGPVATAPASDAPLGVWPWPGDDVNEAMLTEAEDAARTYVESRVGFPVENGFVLVSDEVTTVTFTTGVSTVVTLRRSDDGWHVLGATSDLVTADVRDDGSIDYAVGAAGDFAYGAQAPGGEASIAGPTPVEQGPKGTMAAYGVMGEPTVTRHWFTLRTDAGVTGLTEVRVDHREEPTTTESALPATAVLPPGVWPFPHDEVDEATLDDPVATARAYVDDRVGISDRTTVSEYRSGDGGSGEVVFGGDIQTTVFVRMLDGLWHVEGAASELVTLHDDGDGSITAVVEAKGWLQSHVVLSTGHAEALVPAGEVDAGTEITDVLAYDLNTDRVVKAVRFLLTFGPEGIKGLSEVAFRPPFAESTVPDDAVWSEGGLDARAVAVAYLADRLAGRDVRVDEPESIDKGRIAEVAWEAGVIRLRYADGLWYVVEAIGDSIRIAGTSLDVGYVGGTVTLAQAGTVHLSVGDTAWDVRNDVDAEGTDVPFEHEVPTDPPVILRAVFETDTGSVSLAERVIG